MAERLTAAPRPGSAGEIFLAFTRLALQGFGGVLPVAQHELVERRRWLTAADFLEVLAVSQVLPGPNIVNLGLILGSRWCGLRGAFAAASGLLLFPLVIVLALALAYTQASSHPALAQVVTGALRGMGAVAAGLVLAMAWKLARGLKTGHPLRLWGCVALGATTVLAVAAMRWPLVAVVPLLGALAWALTWWRLAPQPGTPPPEPPAPR